MNDTESKLMHDALVKADMLRINRLSDEELADAAEQAMEQEDKRRTEHFNRSQSLALQSLRAVISDCLSESPAQHLETCVAAVEQNKTNPEGTRCPLGRCTPLFERQMEYATYPQDKLGITNPEDWSVESLVRAPEEGGTEWLTFTCSYQGGERATVEHVSFEEGVQIENIKMWLANMDEVLLPKPLDMSKLAFTVQYTWNLVCLWANRKIDWPTLCWAYCAKPIAVCGRDGSY